MYLCLQEYCDVGTLDSVVSSWEGEGENDALMLQLLLLLKDVASGLQVLHASNVVHGDLVRVEATPYTLLYCGRAVQDAVECGCTHWLSAYVWMSLVSCCCLQQEVSFSVLGA
jgi:hypothetical protein